MIYVEESTFNRLSEKTQKELKALKEHYRSRHFLLMPIVSMEPTETALTFIDYTTEQIFRELLSLSVDKKELVSLREFKKHVDGVKEFLK